MVELLVVIGVIALLIAILMPALSKARESANRIKCGSNLRQLVTGAIMQAQDKSHKHVFFPNDDGANDTLAHIIPDYISSNDVAICPSTSNSIRPNVLYANSMAEYGRDVLQDIHQPAANAGATFGHSYEVFGWYDGLNIFPDGTVIDGSTLGDSNAQRGVNRGEAGFIVDPSKAQTNSEIKRLGALHGSTTTILILDSDQDANTATTNNNWPDATNNHGKAGLNIGFGDGHVEWVPRGPGLVETYLRGYTTAAMTGAPDFFMKQRPGLKIETVTYGGKSFTKWSYSF